MLESKNRRKMEINSYAGIPKWLSVVLVIIAGVFTFAVLFPGIFITTTSVLGVSETVILAWLVGALVITSALFIKIFISNMEGLFTPVVMGLQTLSMTSPGLHRIHHASVQFRSNL